MSPTEQTYPWYKPIEGADIEQGDIFEACPVFAPPAEVALDAPAEISFQWEERDVVVMSQSCDMELGHEKITEVLLCALWRRSQLTLGHLASARGLEDARRGNLPAYLVLAECELPDHQREVCIVDFRRVYSLSLGYLRRRAQTNGTRIRLLPPYREHLAQGFARFFMRVGLPVQVPPFR
jgi:hypothetical protein